MDEQAYRAFEPAAGLAGEPTRAWHDRESIGIAGSCDHDAEPGHRRISEGEPDYCRARAEAEAIRATEATHPAARAAHLEMAARYRERALAARQLGIPEIQDWTSEGGSWLPDE
jgi:hypothetical protein